jgi:subtilisin-like proprotein convertase family protein
VQEQATFAPDTINRWMGSAAMDHEGNLAVGFSVSSTVVFPGVRYAGRLAGDPAGGLFQGEATMQAGGFIQANTASRWGDYSSTNLDPSDDCTFWHTNEYYLDDQPGITAEWHTRIGRFKVNPACVAPAQGTLQVNVTNCATLAPVQGAYVSVNGNLYGATGAGGQNNSQLAPGSYSVLVSAPGYQPIAAVPATITNGNTTVINVCLTGIPSIQSAGSTITAESCPPADNAISPGETVTIDFGMKNVGTAPTANLVATLQATGGVNSPSGPQSYGVLPNDGSTVSRSFTFTADSNLACGNSITATFDLQDGPNNLGTVTYTFKLGSLGFGLTTATYSSGNIAVPIPDVSTVDIPITVGDLGAVGDVNVKVRLNHTFDGDLELSLIAPDGSTVLLADNRGGSGDNYGTGANDCSGTHTIFDDAASAAIASGVSPFAGSFKPDQPLAALNGKDITGTWKLRVSDTAALDVGTVGCVQLEISRREYLCCPFTGGTPGIQAQPPATLVSECGTNGAPDPGEVVTMSFPLVNTGSAPTTNLIATLQNSGGVIPISGPQSYGALSPIGGVAVARNFTFAVSSLIACGANFTATFDLTDGAVFLGTASFTIKAGGTVTTSTTFSNTSAITIPAAGTGASTGAPATPYPSNITVSGITGTVSNARVKLNGLNHTFPSDVDMLLVGPLGQKFTILSDVIGSADWININYTLDDNAAALVPSSGTPVSGAFKPTNYGTGDLFPAPAPAAPYLFPATAGVATFGSVFNGLNPNGTWSLYVVDDLGGDVGNISGGWSLEIITTDPLCESIAPVSITAVSVNKPSLWPPNHQMQEVTVNYAVTSCSSCTLSVSSNEPVDGTGDGDAAPDWEIVDNQHVRLRAERAGSSNDRIYTITITCLNGVNTDVKTVQVVVPHDKK